VRNNDDRVVHEDDGGARNRAMAQQFVGETCGLFLQHDAGDHDGDGITDDSTVDDITTEPTNPGYERLVLKNDMNPTFDVDGYDGAVDAVFFVDDDGDLLTAFPLGIPVRLGDHDDLTEVTPQIFLEDAAE